MTLFTKRSVAALMVALCTMALTACGQDLTSSTASGSSNTSSGSAAGQPGGEDTADADFPNVLEAELTTDDGGNTYSLSVTMSSKYDTPERYADGWRVLDADGNELGAMTLGHDHASEQPFTRTQSGLEIPDDVDMVTIEGRDLENGYGGATLALDVPS